MLALSYKQVNKESDLLHDCNFYIVSHEIQPLQLRALGLSLMGDYQRRQGETITSSSIAQLLFNHIDPPHIRI